jgi:hypothetical protein
MAMDWSNFGGAFMGGPQEDVEDDEDFYGGYDQNHSYTNGNDHMQTTAGASAQDQVGRYPSSLESTDLTIFCSILPSWPKTPT